MDFCEVCQSMLLIDTDTQASADKLYLSCSECQAKKEKPLEQAFMIYERDFTKKSAQLTNEIRFACEDITKQRIMKRCPTCKKEEVVVIVMEPETLKANYVCCICRNYWE